MCGICGWVDFERDLRDAGDIVRAMVETMACRGPDDEGLWLAPHAAIGHRRLAIIDIAGGRQPMTAEQDGRPAAVLTYSGEVYNFREVRRELAARGHAFRTRSDTEVVLRAYLEWGEDLAAHLNGMYAFAIWDTSREDLLLVRDRMGIKPLYYYPTPHGVLFGSEPKAILANPLAERVLDADGLRELLAFVKTPEHGVFRGMYEVRPGQVVRVSPEGMRKRRYWRLEAHEHPDDVASTVKTVRGLLEDITARQLVSDVPLCTLLSGGLDSSTITALAARELKDQGRGPVRSFAVDFTGYTENFTPDLDRATPDAPYVHDLARHVEAEHTDIVLDSADLLDRSVRAAVLRARDLPIGVGDMDTSLYLLFRAVRAHSTVALSGESADEVFGGYRWFHDPDAVAARTFPWLSAGTPHTTVERLFRDDVLHMLDIPGYRAGSYRQAIAEVPVLAGETGRERRMREIGYLHLTRFVQILLDRKDRMSMANGLEVRVPFCDHRLVEYVFNTPWAMKTFDGREKSLLRAAAADLLPGSVLQRVKSPYPTTRDPSYGLALREETRARIRAEDPPCPRLIDQDKVLAMLDHPGGGTGQACRSALERLLQLDSWLREYRVRLDI
ncbi:asparagine synthase (glutamine-hydrolyzing) [Thermocatellispora tengchongensis]|uniref:asparagine synthase (glutamine-hydrolyzing) n=2 Tax=Thermocatellispora tengchongensis TaxID=1073253 RepID=A0A840P6C2_9ACTN|nr:asparagine synthase (glutamine-hydrolyzing) [Thermocatellispora tengchongensis]MBB5133453.1 asparagine synthase (glutamine-hydrolyzing) [Thermocatellispora tengchongensis]